MTTSSHGLEKAMELAKFSKSQKERAREILEAGMLEGMYGHLAPTTGGFIGGMCVGNVSPGGEPVNLNAKVTGYLPKIKEMAEKTWCCSICWYSRSPNDAGIRWSRK